MNIFILDEDPQIAAQSQCDIHVRKMILESAQMLCTTHRVLDGIMSKQPSKSGKTLQKHWTLPDKRENTLYKACHVNHPCTLWVRKSIGNYEWLYDHFIYLSYEYTHRFNKIHASYLLLSDILKEAPKNIPTMVRTEFAIAINEELYPNCKIKGDVVQSYRNYYNAKDIDMEWTKRSAPEWFVQ